MTVDQKRRTLFGRYAASIGLRTGIRKESLVFNGDWDIAPGGYVMEETNVAWHAFNAALDAVEIELPEPAGDPAYNAGVDAMLAAIESTGLGLRVEP